VADVLKIHPVNPQLRLIRRAVEHLRNGAVIAYPTDSSYALGCMLGDKAAMQRIRTIRGIGMEHRFTLVCRDLSEIATYAKVDNSVFRLLKSATPGAYTFILEATHQVPRRLQDAKRKSVGIRVPDNVIDRALLDTLGEPLMSCTLIPRDDDLPLSDPEDVRERLGKQVDVLVDGGNTSLEPTTVVDFSHDAPSVVRQGRGSLSAIGL
jgi:tRNA threonylcarbamoyl adenosine modification protein (Sua5/YciO/YrdC/YwlC family)